MITNKSKYVKEVTFFEGRIIAAKTYYGYWDVYCNDNTFITGGLEFLGELSQLEEMYAEVKTPEFYTEGRNIAGGGYPYATRSIYCVYVKHPSVQKEVRMFKGYEIVPVLNKWKAEEAGVS